MKSRSDKVDEATKLFMFNRDAKVFLGGPIPCDFKAKFVITDSGHVLYRLDWLLGERSRRRLEPPQMLCNRNTGRLNRVRADGRTFKVKPCKDVVAGAKYLP